MVGNVNVACNCICKVSLWEMESDKSYFFCGHQCQNKVGIVGLLCMWNMPFAFLP